LLGGIATAEAVYAIFGVLVQPHPSRMESKKHPIRKLARWSGFQIPTLPGDEREADDCEEQ
jgi:hypothetical protein